MVSNAGDKMVSGEGRRQRDWYLQSEERPLRRILGDGTTQVETTGNCFRNFFFVCAPGQTAWRAVRPDAVRSWGARCWIVYYGSLIDSGVGAPASTNCCLRFVPAYATRELQLGCVIAIGLRFAAAAEKSLNGLN